MSSRDEAELSKLCAELAGEGDRAKSMASFGGSSRR